MPPEDEWEEPDPDSLMRSERKHEWISEPRYKRMFDDIEHALQGVMGKGPFEWVDRRVSVSYTHLTLPTTLSV